MEYEFILNNGVFILNNWHVNETKTAHMTAILFSLNNFIQRVYFNESLVFIKLCKISTHSLRIAYFAKYKQFKIKLIELNWLAKLQDEEVMQ